MQGCGDVNADRLGSLAQLLRKAVLFCYQGGCLMKTDIEIAQEATIA